MPVAREDMRRPRENFNGSAITSNSVLFTKPRDVRIEYTPVKKDREARRDSHISHASSMMHGYGCKCPKTLKHFAKYMWLLVLLIYIFVMPYLVSKLFMKVKSSQDKLTSLETLVMNHLKVKSVSPRQVQRTGASNEISDTKHQYRKQSQKMKEMMKRVQDIEEK